LPADVFSNKKLQVRQIEKSKIVGDPKLTESVAPKVPSLLACRAGSSGWVRLPGDELNRTPARLLMFLSDVWSCPELEPVEALPSFDSSERVGKSKYALLVDYLPERDYPVVKALKSSTTPRAPSQQTHDALLHMTTSRGKDLRKSGRLSVMNRLFLPEDNEFHLSIDPERDQEAPIIVETSSKRVHSKGTDIFTKFFAASE
jgi:hypothetical protein